MANPDNERTNEIDGIETRQAKTLQLESQQQGTQGNNDINNGGDMEKYLNEGPSPEDIGRGWGEINTNQEERKSIFKQYREFKKINKALIRKLKEFSREESYEVGGHVVEKKHVKKNIKQLIRNIEKEHFLNLNNIKKIITLTFEKPNFGDKYTQAKKIALGIAAYQSNLELAKVKEYLNISNVDDDNAIKTAESQKHLIREAVIDAIDKSNNLTTEFLSSIDRLYNLYTVFEDNSKPFVSKKDIEDICNRNKRIQNNVSEVSANEHIEHEAQRNNSRKSSNLSAISQRADRPFDDESNLGKYVESNTLSSRTPEVQYDNVNEHYLNAASSSFRRKL